MKKTVLFLIQRPPYGNTVARDTVDAILACASFDQTVCLLFAGDGVWQLIPMQQGDKIGMKDIGKLLHALPYYDVTTCYAEKSAMITRGITTTSACIPVQPLEDNVIQQLLRAADQVIAL